MDIYNFMVVEDAVYYMGIEIVPVKGLSDTQMVAADARNLIIGTDLLRDLEEIIIEERPHHNKISMDAHLLLGFVIPFEDEVVFYS